MIVMSTCISFAKQNALYYFSISLFETPLKIILIVLSLKYICGPKGPLNVNKVYASFVYIYDP